MRVADALGVDVLLERRTAPQPVDDVELVDLEEIIGGVP